VVVARSNRNRKVLGIPMPVNGSIKADAKKVAGAVNHAAKRADKLGRRVSSVASSVQQMSEAAEEGAKKA
jgi:methyl-accepting chemotaxis protein